VTVDEVVAALLDLGFAPAGETREEICALQAQKIKEA
jgi:hypothetical protein